MKPEQIEAVKGIGTLLASAFPGASLGILLGTSLVDLLHRQGVQGEDYAAIIQEIGKRINESAAERQEAVKSLGDRLKSLEFLDE